MRAFHRHQAFLILAVVGALVVTMAAGFYSRKILVPIPWDSPFYINPVYPFLLVLFGLVGLFTVFRADDRGWPVFVGLLGLAIFLIAFEDSILQWFVLQLGASTIGGRVNPLLIAGALAAMGAAILLHAGQLGRRLHHGFAERGIDPRELSQVEEHTNATARILVLRFVVLAALGGLALFIAEFALARARVGIGALGILGGLLIMSILAVMAYRVLRMGPGPVRAELGEETAPFERRGRKPPRGLR